MKILFLAFIATLTNSNSWALPDGDGTQVGIFTSLIMPKDSLKALLPEGLEMVAVPGIPEGHHPVTIFAGKQYNVRAKLGTSVMGEIPEYDEVIYTITNVKHKDHPELYTFSPSIYVSSRRAKLAGDFYGLVKTYLPPHAFNYYGAGNVDVPHSLNGTEVFLPTELLSVTGLVPTEAHSLKLSESYKRNYEFMKANARNVIVKTLTGFKCIKMDLGFDSEASRTSALPSLAAVKIPDSAKFMAPIKKDRIKTLADDPFGAFFIKTKWTMEAPKACW